MHRKNRIKQSWQLITMLFVVCSLQPVFSLAQDETGADSLAINENQQKPIGQEVVSKRTAKSKTYINFTDNTLITVASSGYMHYRDEAGRFHDIDRRIRIADSTSYEVTKGLYHTLFPYNLQDEIPVTFSTKDGKQIFSKLKALAYFDRISKEIKIIHEVQSSIAVCLGNKIHYADAFPGIDVEYEYGDTKLKQTFFLNEQSRKDLPKPQSFGLAPGRTLLVLISEVDFSDGLDAFVEETKVTAPGQGNTMLLTYEGEKELIFRVAQGKNMFKLLKDVAFGPEPDTTGTVAWDMEPMLRRFYREDNTNLMLTGVPINWLNKHKKGTVILDPTVSLGSPTDDVWIEYNKSTNFNSYAELRIGRLTTYGWKRSLVHFDLDAIPSSATISSADVQLYFYRKGGTAVTRTIKVHQMLVDWKEAEATWYKRLTSTNWGTNGVGLDDVDAEATEEDSQDWNVEYPIWKIYDITSLTQKWVDGTATNYGVIFWATNEDDYTDKDEKYAYSSEYTGDVTKRPKLVITYTLDPIVEYIYDALSRPDTVTYGNGMVETSQYDDDRDWLTRRDYKNGGSNLFYFANSSYDAAGNIKKQVYAHTTASADSMEYTYDNLYRLDNFKHNTVSKRTYSYDDNGNFKTFAGRTFTYGNDNNQLTNDGSRAYEFDVIGRVKKIGATDITYDILNNMTSYGSDSYSYNSANQRLKKTESGTTTYYVSSGLSVLAEYDGSANLEAEYIYGLDGMVSKFDSTQGHFWFVKDHLGSTRRLDSSSMLRDYYPFGEDYTSAGSETDYTFTGKEKDGSELYYFGARYYDARVGRWMSVDPLAGEYPGLSPYNYTFNNPLKYNDPDGKGPRDPLYGVKVVFGTVGTFIASLFGIEAKGEVGIGNLKADLKMSTKTSVNSDNTLDVDVNKSANLQISDGSKSIGVGIESDGSRTKSSPNSSIDLGVASVAADKTGVGITLKTPTPAYVGVSIHSSGKLGLVMGVGKTENVGGKKVGAAAEVQAVVNIGQAVKNAVTVSTRYEEEIKKEILKE